MRVPLADQQTQGTVVPGIGNARPEAFGVGLGEATRQTGEILQKAGQRLDEHALQMQDREDTRVVMENTTAMQRDIDELLNKKDEGLLTKQLTGANGATITYDQKVAEIRAKYARNMASPNMLLQFDNTANQYQEHGRSQVLNHETDQFNKAELKAYEDALRTNDAALLANPTLENFKKFSDMNANLTSAYATKKWNDPKMAANATIKERGRTASLMLSALLSNEKPMDAEVFYNEHKKEIDEYNPEVSMQIKQGIKKAVAADIEVKTELIKSTAGDYFDKPGDFDVQFNAIDDLYDERVKRESMSEESARLLKIQDRSEMVKTQIARILKVEGDNKKALIFFETYKGTLDPRTAADIEIIMKADGLKNDVRTAFDALKSFKLADGSIDLERAREEIRKQFKGPNEDEAIDVLEQIVGDFERDQGRVEHANVKGITEGIDTIYNRNPNNGKGEAQNLLRSFKGLTASQIRAAKEYIEQTWPTLKGGDGFNIKVNPIVNAQYKTALSLAINGVGDDQFIIVDKNTGAIVDGAFNSNTMKKVKVTGTTIDAYFTAGYIDKTTYGTLTNQIGEFQKKGRNQDQANKDAQFKIFAKAKFPRDDPSSLSDRLAFIDRMRTATASMDYTQTVDYLSKSANVNLLYDTYRKEQDIRRNHPGEYKQLQNDQALLGSLGFDSKSPRNLAALRLLRVKYPDRAENNANINWVLRQYKGEPIPSN